MPVLLVGADRVAVRVQFVHIRVERRVQVDGVVVQLREFQTQVDREITPVHRVGGEVVTAVDREIIDEADHFVRLFARRVVFVDDLYLQVVRHAEVKARRHPARRVALRETRIDLVQEDGVARFVHFLDLAAGNAVCLPRIDWLLVVAVIAPETLFEIGVVTDGECRSDYVTELLHLAVREEFLKRRVEAV